MIQRPLSIFFVLVKTKGNARKGRESGYHKSCRENIYTRDRFRGNLAKGATFHWQSNRTNGRCVSPLLNQPFLGSLLPLLRILFIIDGELPVSIAVVVTQMQRLTNVTFRFSFFLSGFGRVKFLWVCWTRKWKDVPRNVILLCEIQLIGGEAISERWQGKSCMFNNRKGNITATVSRWNCFSTLFIVRSPFMAKWTRYRYERRKCTRILRKFFGWTRRVKGLSFFISFFFFYRRVW